MANGEVIEVSRRTVMILIIASLAINVFFLLMGILIGREDAPPVVEPATAESMPEETVTDPIEEDLSVFQDELDYAEPQTVDPNYTADSTLSAKAAESDQRASQQPSEPAQSRAEAPPPEPAKATSTSRTTSNEKTASSLTKGIYVQVLAIEDAKKAAAFRDKVTRAGYISHLIHEGNYYKVLVGPYDARGAAEDAKSRLRGKFNAAGWIRNMP